MASASQPVGVQMNPTAPQQRAQKMHNQVQSNNDQNQYQHTPNNFPTLSTYSSHPQSSQQSQHYMEVNAPIPQTTTADNWKTVSHKRRRIPHDNIMTQSKQTNEDTYWLDAPPITNRFSILTEEEDSAQHCTEIIAHTPTPPPIFVYGVKNISPLVQLLEQVAHSQYEIKALSNDQVRIKPTTAEHYRIIIKALADKQTDFHTYKLKEEKGYKVVLKNMHHSISTEDIKEEIEKLNHKVANIWNIKHYRTKLPLPMFFVELRPAPNNKDIFNIEFLQQCRIKFEPPRQTRNIAQCAKCQRYGHTKNYCYQKPRCVKCAGNHLTEQCQRKERTRDVKCVLCTGNHPANYKGCMVYKQLQQQKFPSLRQKQYIPPASIQRYQQKQPGMTYSQAVTQQYSPATAIQMSTANTTNPAEQTSGTHELQAMMKDLMTQMNTLLKLLTTLLAKMN
jgi:hypothetical protein